MGSLRVASSLIGYPFAFESEGGGAPESAPNTENYGPSVNLADVLTAFGKTEGTDYEDHIVFGTQSIDEYDDTDGTESVMTNCGSNLRCLCEHSRYFQSGNSPNCNTVRIIYWYHPDYLGNNEYITDWNGDAYQYFWFSPWGESLESQHKYEDPNAGTFFYNSPFRFNGKELDAETGNYYHGARYYNPKISVWLSVDPWATKYPYITPYNFVENNPVNLVDPTGLGPEVIIKGEKAEEATAELNASSDLNITRDKETGKLSATGEATSEADKQLLEAIESTEHVVEVNAVEDDVIEVGGKKYRLDAGAFLGGFKEGKDGKPTAIQYVNTKHMKNIEKAGGNKAGVGLTHEVLEAWSGVQRESLEFVQDAIGFGRADAWFDNLYLPSHNQAIKWDPRFTPAESPGNYQRIINGKTIDIRTGNQVK